MEEQINDLARLNDQLRRNGIGGKLLATQGIISLSQTVRSSLMKSITQFADFSEDNDPHGEHDFGCVELNGAKFYWKIDYYDTQYEGLSPNPLDQSVTRRVMTVMRADEY